MPLVPLCARLAWRGSFRLRKACHCAAIVMLVDFRALLVKLFASRATLDGSPTRQALLRALFALLEHFKVFPVARLAIRALSALLRLRLGSQSA